MQSPNSDPQTSLGWGKAENTEKEESHSALFTYFQQTQALWVLTGNTHSHQGLPLQPHLWFSLKIVSLMPQNISESILFWHNQVARSKLMAFMF